MYFAHACRVSGIFTIFFLVFASANTEAQTLVTTASATKSTAAIKPPADFSFSIDPASVKNFSDDQLNETFDKMSAQYSRNAVVFNNIGAAFFDRKIYDKAEAALKRAIILNNHPGFLTNLSILYDTQKRLPEAISAAQRAVSQSPKYERGRIQLCELMVVSGRSSDALICYDELAKFAQLDVMSQTLYAMSYLKMGNLDRAIAVASPLAHSAQPTPLMLNVLGYAYYQKKRYKQAVDIYRQAVELEPDSTTLRYNLAMALTATDNTIGALSQYNFVKEKDSKMADQLYRYLYRDKIIYVNDTTASKQP